MKGLGNLIIKEMGIWESQMRKYPGQGYSISNVIWRQHIDWRSKRQDPAGKLGD